MNFGKRPYVSNKFALDLQNQTIGWLYSAEGGMASTEVVQARLSNGYPVSKQAGNIKVDDITVTCGASMGRPFYEWLQTSVDYQHERREGAIIIANYDFQEVVRQNFHEALISEIGLPGVDAASKDACKFTIKIATEYTERQYANSGQDLQAQFGRMNQKRWQVANFSLNIDRMNCKKVHKVEAITIKQNIIENTIGERCFFQKEPAGLEFPNVVFTIPESESQDLYSWYEDFVCKGNSNAENERTGALDYLTSDCSDVLCTVEFYKLGIIKFTPEKLESTTDKLHAVKVEMYCESMKFIPRSIGTDF